MNHISPPFSQKIASNHADMNKSAGKLIEKFNVSDQGLSARNWHLLSEILDFAVEAEQTIADQKQRIQELEKLSSSDCLTGLLNRRGLIIEMDHALARAKRHYEHGLFIYIDLDDFKNINDTYGHAVGDELLCHVAHILSSAIRGTDYAARLGGDEFGLLLTHCDPCADLIKIQDIRRAFEKQPFIHKGMIIPINASMGMADVTPDSHLQDIFSAADEAMYHHKKRQKNKMTNVIRL